MALRLIEGFDDGLTVERGWQGTTATTTGRFGGICRIVWQQDACIYPFNPVLTGTITTGMAFLSQNVAGARYMFDLGNARLVYSNGFLIIRRADTDVQVAISASSYWQAPNVWRYIEMQYVPATGAVTVRVDGVSAVSGTVPTTANVSSIILKGPGYLIFDYDFYDDLYVLDSSGTTNTTWLGDVRVQTLYPNADGANSALTPSTGTAHAVLVDEPTPNTTDYVSSSTPGAKDTYQFQDLNSNTAGVYGLEVTNYSHKDAAGPGSMANVVRSGGTDYTQPAQPLSASWTANKDLLNTNPATSAPWTVSDVNSAEFGVEVS